MIDIEKRNNLLWNTFKRKSFFAALLLDLNYYYLFIVILQTIFHFNIRKFLLQINILFQNNLCLIYLTIIVHKTHPSEYLLQFNIFLIRHQNHFSWILILI